MNGPKGFLVILPGQMIEIPQDSHLAWLRMFYALPRELVEKRPAYLEMPRNIRRVLGSEKYRAMLQSDSFLELVWDCYAWAVWQFFQIPHKDGTPPLNGTRKRSASTSENTAFTLRQLQGCSLTLISSFVRMRSICRSCGMTSSAKWAKYCLSSVHSAKAMSFD